MAKRLNWLEECRESATIWLAEYQQKLARRYNQGVKIREFGIEDLALRKVMGNMRDTNIGKLARTWEGPYRVTAIEGVGAYYLEDLDEKPLPRPWNVHNLKKFYHWPSIHGVKSNMYILLTNIMMISISVGAFNFIITYLIVPVNKHKKC